MKKPTWGIIAIFAGAIILIVLAVLAALSNSAQYGFFDGSQDLAAKGYAGQDRLSLKQFVVMGTVFVLIVSVSFLLKKAKKEKLFTVYKVLAIIMPVLEIAKISFSTYHNLKHGELFDLGGMLPLYTCSMLLYFLPFVAWGKGRLKKTSMAFFVTIGLAAGLTNFVYLSAAGWYPIFTFGGLYSVLFHGAIVFVGLSLLITGEYTPTWKSILEGMIPVLIFSVLVIPVNFAIQSLPQYDYVDYMLLMNANGFVPAISNFFIDHHIQLLFSLIMLLIVYPLAAAVIVLAEMVIRKAFGLLYGFRGGKSPGDGSETLEKPEN